jgi:hypothetical protein
MIEKFQDVMDAVRGVPWSGGRTARFAHGIWKDHCAKIEAREKYPEYRDIESVYEAYEYLREGCQCAVCVVYGGDCPRYESMQRSAAQLLKWIRKMER